MRRLFLKLFRRRQLEQDLEAELAFHREMSGNDAHIPFGNTAVIKEQAFDLWRFNALENLWRDVVYGIRGLRKHPSLVVTALLSLGLGIGANTALFSLGVEFLLSEPSVTDAKSMVAIQLNGNSHADLSEIQMLRDSGLFTGLAGEFEEGYINYNNGSETNPIFSTFTTKDFFTTAGAPMAYGRGYSTTDPDQVVVLHHHFWAQHFNSDPNIVGQALTLDGKSYTVVGVLPDHFRTLIGFGFAPDVFVPAFPETPYLAAFARLKPATTLGQVQAAAQAIATRSNEGRKPSERESHPHATVEAISGFAHLKNENLMAASLFFLMLMALSGLVLVIACANVASLLLARASSRRREMAVRLSLGASRARMMQQLLVESLLLSLGGAACGLGLAQLMNMAMAHFTAPTPIPIRLNAETDWRVTLYAALLSVIATAACGLLPAWQSVRESFSTDLQRAGKMFLRRAIVVGQVAVSIVVLSTGFLFVRNLLRSSALSPGFDVNHTIRSMVNLPPSSYKDPKKVALYTDRGIKELAALPGVQAVAAARVIPFTDTIRNSLQVNFTGIDQTVRVKYYTNGVTAGYFDALSIPLLLGRTFQASDFGAPERPVIVNACFVNQYLGGRRAAAIGQTFTYKHDPSQIFRIIGIAANTKNMTIGEQEWAQLYQYLPNMAETRYRVQFIIKSATPPVMQLKAIDETLRRIDPSAGLETKTLFSSIGFAFLPSQIGAAVLGSMGVLGLLLAMIGLYGVMAYSVARRTQEIGVRMAIGASASSIFKLIFSDAGRLVLIGSVIGIGVALIATRPLASFLVAGLPAHDPVTFIAVLIVFGITAALASWGPARRATGIDPASCLRHD